MSGLLLGIAAIAWAVVRDREDGPLRGVAVLHTAGLLAFLALRGSWWIDGWAAGAAAGVWVAGLLVAWRPAEARRLGLVGPLAVVTGASALWAALPAGPGLVGWTAWGALHVPLAVVATGVCAAAALVATARLRGHVIGLTVVALLLVTVPIFGSPAVGVTAYVDGEPLDVRVRIADPEGDEGAVRVVRARVALPGEAPLRAAVVLSLLALFAAAVVRWSARHPVFWRPTWRLALAALGVHTLLLLSAAVPRDLGVEAAALAAHAEALIGLEAVGLQSAVALDLPAGPFTGGWGAPAIPLSLTLLAIGFLLAAKAPAQRPDPASLLALESRLVTLACLLLGLTAATGAAWSNFVWGSPAPADPRLFATFVAMLLLGAHLTHPDPDSRLRPWLCLSAALVLGFAMIGPELGLTAPSLHAFGP